MAMERYPREPRGGGLILLAAGAVIIYLFITGFQILMNFLNGPR